MQTEPVLFRINPIGHSLHKPLTTSMYSPGRHSSEHSPCSLLQLTHDSAVVAPLLSVYVPDVQERQVDAAGLVENCPLLQTEQVDEPMIEKLPDKHTLQVEDPISKKN